MQKRILLWFLSTWICSGMFCGCASRNEIKWDVRHETETVSETECETETDACEETETVSERESEPITEEKVTESARIFVDICGAIRQPGVYELEKGSRMIDVIRMAGGLSEDADDTVINRAEILRDGDKIMIFTKEEIASFVEKEILSEGQLIGISFGESLRDLIREDKKTENGTGETTDGSEQTDSLDNPVTSENGNSQRSAEGNGRININTADETQLQTLNGIGEVRAKDIIAYRNLHGAFQSIEEIMNVSGIKQGTFQKIKDYITIE